MNSNRLSSGEIGLVDKQTTTKIGPVSSEWIRVGIHDSGMNKWCLKFQTRNRMLKTTMASLTFDCEVEVYKVDLNYAPEHVGRWEHKCTGTSDVVFMAAGTVGVDTHWQWQGRGPYPH